MAFPMPELPPVTMATLPLSDMASPSLAGAAFSAAAPMEPTKD
jgi:hypothetical protein